MWVGHENFMTFKRSVEAAFDKVAGQAVERFEDVEGDVMRAEKQIADLVRRVATLERELALERRLRLGSRK